MNIGKTYFLSLSTADTTRSSGASADEMRDVSADSMPAAFRAGHCTAHAAARGVSL